MKKILLIAISITSLISCVSFEKFSGINLRNTDKIGDPAVTHNGGKYLDDKHVWKGDVESNDETLVIKRNKRNSFAQLDVKSLDFRGKVAIVIKAKSFSEKSPKLRVSLLDRELTVANGRDLTQTIVQSDDFLEYVYFLEGSFTQLSPEIKKVKAADITQVRLYISGEEGAKIEVSDVSVVLASSMQKTKKNTAVGQEADIITSFDRSRDFKEVSAKGAGLSVESSKGSAIKLVCDNVGAAYQSIAINMNSTDFSKHPIVVVRAKCKLKDGQEAPFLRLDLVDDRGNVTNRMPVWREINGQSTNNVKATSTGKTTVNSEGVVQLEEIELSVDGTYYVDYYYDFTNRFEQSYPKPVKVDAQRINKAVLYVNPGYNRFTGEIYIDKIEVL